MSNEWDHSSMQIDQTLSKAINRFIIYGSSHSGRQTERYHPHVLICGACLSHGGIWNGYSDDCYNWTSSSSTSSSSSSLSTVSQTVPIGFLWVEQFSSRTEVVTHVRHQRTAWEKWYMSYGGWLTGRLVARMVMNGHVPRGEMDLIVLVHALGGKVVQWPSRSLLLIWVISIDGLQGVWNGFGFAAWISVDFTIVWIHYFPVLY